MKYDWKKNSAMYERHIQTLDLKTSEGVFKNCHVVGGPEGVMATCRVPRDGMTDLIYILIGDDGHWETNECFDETWLAARIAVLRRVQDGKS